MLGSTDRPIRFGARGDSCRLASQPDPRHTPNHLERLANAISLLPASTPSSNFYAGHFRRGAKPFRIDVERGVRNGDVQPGDDLLPLTQEEEST